MGSTREPVNLWRHLPYGLSLLGLLVILLTGVNFWLQQDSAPPVAGASSQLTGSNDQATTQRQNRLLAVLEGPSADVRLGMSFLQKARETGDPSYYSRAEEALSQALAVETHPDWLKARAMTGLGVSALGRHEFEEALVWARRSLEIDPSYASTYGVLGDAQLELGQYDAAARSFQAMVDLKPDLTSYARAARIRELRGDTAGAVEAMKMAVSAGPVKTEAAAWAQVQLGDLYFGSGQIDRAAEHYEAALKEFPGYYLALAALGQARAAQGRYDEAVGLYQDSIDIVPLPSTLAALGDLYARGGEKALAQAQYDIVEFIAKLAALNQQVYNRELALFYADHHIRLAEALELAASELKVRQDIYGYDALAWALYKNHRLDEAAVAIAEALRLDTRDAVLHYHAGKIFQGLGDNERAAFHLEHALDLNPHFSVLHADGARQALSSLRSEVIPSSYAGGSAK